MQNKLRGFLANVFINMRGLRCFLIYIVYALLTSCRPDGEPVDEDPPLHAERLDNVESDTLSEADGRPLADGDEFVEKNVNPEWEFDTVFVTVARDSVQLSIKYRYLDELTETPFLYAKAPCKFKVGERMVPEYGVEILAYRNRKLFFQRQFTKSDFLDVMKKSFLKRHVLTGARFVSYNKRYKQMIFLMTLAESGEATDWYGQTYLTIDLKGQIVQKGVVDYPHHCQDMFSISHNGEYILTCSEFADFRGERRKFESGSVALARIINDTLYTVAYDLKRDSIRCDTLMYYKNDTLTAEDYVLSPDTITPNAYIFHVDGDTLARFRFNGYFDYGEGYVTQFNFIKSLNLATYYDFKKDVLHVFDISKTIKEKKYPLKKLKKYETRNISGRSVLFRGEKARIRFYFNNARKVIGYAYLS